MPKGQTRRALSANATRRFQKFGTPFWQTPRFGTANSTRRKILYNILRRQPSCFLPYFVIQFSRSIATPLKDIHTGSQGQ
ncbi:MAG: hypothetical protein IIV20_08690, partial [Bacteroidaceae bacterium]|nr:hypothetical protein [Bacteroidaceae bacterium]